MKGIERDLPGGGFWIDEDEVVGVGQVDQGDWIAETKLHLDLGENTVRNYQQAGLIVHENDDDFARLGSVAIWNTRQTEFARELTLLSGGTSFGGSLIGTPAPTTCHVG